MEKGRFFFTAARLPIATAALATAIFIADTVTKLEIAVAVLYVLVILLARRFCRPSGVVLVAAGCVALTILSYSLTAASGPLLEGIVNTLISIVSIGLITPLVLKDQSRELALREARDHLQFEVEKRTQQALLLDQTHDAIFLRNRDGLILYWNRGAQELYGWSAEEAEGKNVRELLKTVFPLPLEEVEALLLRTGRWEGELVHTTRDGTQVTVASRWSLQRDTTGTPIAILHTNNDITERKRAEEGLRSTAEELHRVMAAISDCLWSAEIDEQGKWHYRYYSPVVEKITGRPASSFLNAPAAWFGITHPDDRPAVVSAAQRLASGLSEHEEAEYRITTAEGEIRWVRDSAVATRSAKGIQIDGVISDITARKRAEEALRESENRYRTYLNSGTDAFFVYNWQGRIVDVNIEACVSLGYVREELIGMEFFDIVVRDESLETDIRPRLEAGETMFFECHYRRRDASTFSVDVRIRPFQQGGSWFALVSARDVTQRRRAEVELRQAETRFRTFVDHASDLFLVHDEQGTILDANREAWESLGYTREELIGMHPYDFDRGQVTPPTAVTRARLEAGEIVTFESVVQRRDGSTFPVEWRVRRYQKGENWFALSSARDITERKRAEQERERLRELEADLARINRVNVMGELAASIAHEINQPLSAVVTNGTACLRWLADDSPNLEEAREAASRIVRDGKRAGEVIARIRRLAKRVDVSRERLALDETVFEVLAIIEGEAKRKRVSIHTQLEQDLPPVLADRVQLQQVMLNLVMNAIEAMHNVDERALVIRASNSDADRVVVSVQDQGVGLDSEAIARIFDPFYTTKPSGMGMGLSISRSIVRSHGGQLWAAPNPGPGATFYFDLPKYREEGSDAETDKA